MRQIKVTFTVNVLLNVSVGDHLKMINPVSMNLDNKQLIL